MLLEKAWAKLHGCYSGMEKGLAHEAMRDLTGAPSFEYIIRKDKDKIIEMIFEAKQKGFCVSISTEDGDADKAKKLEELGLLTHHYYAIIDAAEVTDSAGEIHKICKLRNPWSQFEWNGDWSDNSYCWTKEMRKKHKVVAADDGCFWMSWVDIKKNFEKTQICKV